MEMKKRVISAIVMAIILIPVTIIGGSVFTVTMGMIGILALKELLDLKESHGKIPDIMTILAFVNVLLIIFSEFDGYSIAFGLTYKGIALTILSMFIPCLFYKDYTTKEAMYTTGSILFIGLVFNSIILVRNYDIWHFLYIVIVPMLTDVFAFVVGSLIGKHKCAPKISAGKTWEGSIGGSLVSTCISTIFYMNVIHSAVLFKVIGVTLLLSIVGQFGDLVFSKIKRENKIKDFSQLIPGHGGILDRIDSLCFVLITYIILFGII